MSSVKENAKRAERKNTSDMEAFERAATNVEDVLKKANVTPERAQAVLEVVKYEMYTARFPELSKDARFVY